MEKIAVIDIGTNSMRLMISQIEKGTIKKSYKTLQTTRMGQDINKVGGISPVAFERNFKALKEFAQQAKVEEVEEILVFGTSALRDATNGKDFVAKVKEELGLSIEILTGGQEAEIGFMGAIGELPGDALVIDIGGGSTELIMGNKEEGIIELISLDMGALRMTEVYIKSDPIKNEEVAVLKETIRKMLEEGIQQFSLGKTTKIIGIGGTITTLSAIKQNMKDYNWEKIHNSQLGIQEVGDIFQRLRQLKIEEKKEVWGLQPSRADIILSGTIILQSIMEILEIRDLVVSESDNLEGMLYKKLKK